MKFNFLKLSFLMALPLLSLSCDVVNEAIEPEKKEESKDNLVTYVIKSGNHETINPYRSLNTNTLKFEVQFDSTAIYQTKDPKNQADINKLYGMSDCGTFHHENSARFGWRWYNKRLELHAYSYVNGKNTSTFITAVDLNKTYTCELSLTDTKYVYKVGEKTVEQARGCDGQGKGYQLYPYFGGDETAPHEINIKIKAL